MRKKTISLYLIMLLFVSASMAHAIPLVYIFEGTVTNASFSEEQYIEHYGEAPENGFLSTGDSVLHVVLLDYDPDSIPDLEGIMEPVPHQFSAQYLDGTAMIEPNYNFGDNVFNSAGTMYAAGSLFAGGIDPSGLGDSVLAIWNWETTVYDWVVGTSLSAESNFGPYGHVWESLTLTAINNQPVPEPATIFLISTGLVGFAGRPIRRVLKRKLVKR